MPFTVHGSITIVNYVVFALLINMIQLKKNKKQQNEFPSHTMYKDLAFSELNFPTPTCKRLHTNSTSTHTEMFLF